MARYGYHGKILHIDLTSRTSWIEEPDDAFWRIYAGGGLLATYYLLHDCPAGVDPLGPDNVLILSSSVMAGYPYVGLARFTAAAKSPLTGGVGETRCEGPYGVALKGSGADALIFHGAAERPSVVCVEDGQVTFEEADDLWGLTVGDAVDGLERRFGSDVHTAVIGPAGENQVRFASIVTERSYQAARMGMGAVMGSKQLKAVVIRGEHRPPIADPDYCHRLTEDYARRMRANDLTRWQLEPPGFSAWVHLHGLDAALCTRNYQNTPFPEADNYASERYMTHYRHDGDCPGCPNRCIKFFGVGDDADWDPRAGAMHQELAGTLGPNCGNGDLEMIFRANILCNQLGMDPTSLGFTLSMAMECVQEGLLTEEQIGLPLRFGSGRATLEMVHMIAHRQGFGDVLAEGSRRAAEQIGPGAEWYALHVKGEEMVCFEPRTQTNLALGYATAPIGPRYDICEHDWDFDTEVGWAHTLDSSRTLGILKRLPMEYLGADKVRNLKALMNLWSGADALDLCIFAIAPTRVLTLREMADYLSAVTGWEASGHEIMRLGERRLHLMRVYNLCEGLGAGDDTLPDRFFEQPAGGAPRWAETRLDRERFQEMIRFYYGLMGWDQDGRPRYETLVDHHLEWTVQQGHADWLRAAGSEAMDTASVQDQGRRDKHAQDLDRRV